jgi:hypothetical protein
MEIKQLYSFVLLIVMVGAILAVGGITLANFAAQINDTNSAAASNINATNTAMSTIAGTWLPLIVVIAVLAIILTLVIGGFAGAGGKR